MIWWNRLRARLKALRRREQLARDLEDELQFLGNIAGLKETAATGGPWLRLSCGGKTPAIAREPCEQSEPEEPASPPTC